MSQHVPAPAAGSRARPATARPLLAALALAGGAVAASGFAAGASATAAPQRSSAASRYQLTTRFVPGLGRILADASGYVLYAYVPDHRGRSRCWRVCAVLWPPLLLPRAAHAVAGSGVRRRLLGTTPRSASEVQVTYHGWPLYRYRNDHEPGEASGEGDDMGLWYVIRPDGSLVRQGGPSTG